MDLHRLVEMPEQGDRRGVVQRNEVGIAVLRKKKEGRMEMSGNADQSGKGREMFAGALRHFLKEIVKVGSDKHIDRFVARDHSIIRATRRGARDGECLKPGQIRSGDEGLLQNMFFRDRIRP